jgi:hypothetical protein
MVRDVERSVGMNYCFVGNAAMNVRERHDCRRANQRQYSED